MTRAIAVWAAGTGEDLRIHDTLLLTQAERRAAVGLFTGLRGTAVELALPSGSRLVHDDRLALEDGGAVAIVAMPEVLLEVRAGDTASLARAAWLLGDHHIPVEIHTRYLRVLRTAVVERLLATAGVTIRAIEAPFEPEGGAYDHTF
jgi:urease accessory protein